MLTGFELHCQCMSAEMFVFLMDLTGLLHVGALLTMCGPGTYNAASLCACPVVSALSRVHQQQY